ncbi:MAG: redox-sensing transcriptional repressor Rex [Aliifodinibius sp.]|nr:redox-sensing transcriptional repressor Rex [Fodinibius sp.]NIW44543.1 redox-sensing transcriptional repressor Rex [Gammaproteobacteria bacterium]NIX02549.1 redox-sensing transcriptional repressor Rex [Phycisphaerae bacterium]NIY25110.1 redox-sensing transcriptional repressor Rex [Fodinibius sp.]
MQGVVPAIVIGRLPIYLRALALLESEGKEVTSSQELGMRLGISSAQIRKDLSHFGEFGKQGTGYKISFLQERLKEILNLNQNWSVALVGFGDLGNAIVHYAGFPAKGFFIKAVFDIAPHKVGQTINGHNLIIKHPDDMAEVIQQEEIKIAILAVPIKAAQSVSEALVKAGIKAILNYAPINLFLPPDIQVQNIDPVVYLQQMTYYL